MSAICIGVTIAVTGPTGCFKFYRKDYTYVAQFDAYYKLHWDKSGQTWGSAFLACDEESASLFYPKAKDEWTIVKALVEPMKFKPNVTEVFVGIHDEFGLGEFMTVDGQSTPSPLPDREQDLVGESSCVSMDIDTGVFKLLPCDTEDIKPFVCKKVEQPFPPSCPTIDREYTYDKVTKKCYKISQRKKSWIDAMQTCFMEGGILAVINNNQEADVIKYKLREQNLDNVDHFVGFRRSISNVDFYTVKGQQFDHSFYKNWRHARNNYGQNEELLDTRFDCGVVENNDNSDRLATGTKLCSAVAPFICEMSPKV